MSFAADPVITGCTIYGNNNGGVLVRYCDPLIDNSLIVANTGAHAVSCQGGTPDLTCCDIFGNPEGDWTGCLEGQLGQNGNMSVDPRFCAPADSILTLHASSDCLPENNVCGVQVGALGVGCFDYLVYPNGSGYFPTIQDAVDEAVDHSTIILANGTFTGDRNWDVDSQGKIITITSLSGIADSCVIDCSDDGVPHRGFTFHGYTQPHVCWMTDITIKNGQAPPGEFGGALLCEDTSAVHVQRCKFIENSAARGGAVAADAAGAISLVGCELSGNSADEDGGGLYARLTSAVVVANCTIVSNSAPRYGSGIYNGGGNLQLVRDIIADGIGDRAVRCSPPFPPNCTCTDMYGNEGRGLGRSIRATTGHGRKHL